MKLTIKIKGKTYTVHGLADASALFCQIRDETSMTVRARFAETLVCNDGVPVARISYNGNVWPVEPWTPNQVPLLRVSGLFAGDAR